MHLSSEAAWGTAGVGMTSLWCCGGLCAADAAVYLYLQACRSQGGTTSSVDMPCVGIDALEIKMLCWL